jgi:hypothetical protein
MSIYKRWFPPLVLVDGVAIAPAILLATEHRKRDEKHQQRLDLRAWEGEGGNPAPRTPAVQSSWSGDAPEADTANPSFEKSTQR